MFYRTTHTPFLSEPFRSIICRRLSSAMIRSTVREEMSVLSDSGFTELPCAGQYDYRFAFCDTFNYRFYMSAKIHFQSQLSIILECDSIIYENISFVKYYITFTFTCHRRGPCQFICHFIFTCIFRNIYTLFLYFSLYSVFCFV